MNSFVETYGTSGFLSHVALFKPTSLAHHNEDTSLVKMDS